MKWHVGTSGYSYEEWKGSFYPEKIKAAEMLAFYAARLGSVEINNTFYRLPKKSVLESWAEQVPEDFRFAIKASRRITHFMRLKETGEVTAYLLDTTAVLGSKRGVILFQLPPNLKCDLERLDRFLEILPPDLPAAFEFRHESWEAEAVHERLRARDFALVTVDSEEEREEREENRAALVSTASWGYLRLRRSDYDPDALASWARAIESNGWSEAFVFFKHEDAGAGPRMAAEFLEAATAPRTARRAARKTARRETG